MLLCLCFVGYGVSEGCDAGYIGGWETHPALLTLIEASATTSASPDDLKAGMSWYVDVNGGGTVSHVAAVGEVGPYWDMSGGRFITDTGRVAGSSYTLFYYWSPSSATTKSLHSGGTYNDSWVDVNNNNLGFYANRSPVGFKDTTTYDITVDTWQTLIVTGVATDVAAGVGTSTYYVNGEQVGTLDRVASGDTTQYIGLDYPGYVAVAGVLNTALDTTEITALHNHMTSSKTSTGCSACPAGKTSGAGAGQSCEACPLGTYADAGSTCEDCVAGKYSSATGASSSDVCIDCVAGKYSIAGAATCTTCVAGKYNGARGAATCEDCVAGKYSSATGASSSDVCIDCVAGKYSSIAGASTCLDCVAGKYSIIGGAIKCEDCVTGKYSSATGAVSSDVCIDCDAGKYSSVAGASICLDCVAGKYSIMGGAGQEVCSCDVGSYGNTNGECVVCPIGTWKGSAGDEFCERCPMNRITPMPGATALEECLSPEINFYVGFAFVGLNVLFFFEYFVHGRCHRISFLRKKRVTERLVNEARALSPQLYYFAQRAEVDKERDTTFRLLKTWSFLLQAFLISFLFIFAFFVGTLFSMFFKSLIIWKDLNINLDLNIDFISHLADLIDEFARFLHAPWLKQFFIPIEFIFQIFASLNINLEAINITCEGASAPLELFFNLIIIGICVVIIESDFQLFRVLTFNSLTDVFLLSARQPAYKSWVYHEKGAKTIPSSKGKYAYNATIMLTLVVRALSGFNFFQAFMQFLMTFVTIKKFTQDNGVHASSIACNQVPEFIDYDHYIAFLSSYTAYIMIIPMIYEIANILVPGTPSSNVDVLLIIDRSKRYKYIPTSSFMHYLKYLTIASPDLFLSELAAKSIRVIDHMTRKTYTENLELYEKIQRINFYSSYIVVSNKSRLVYDKPIIAPGKHDVKGSLKKGDIVETLKIPPTEQVFTKKGRRITWMQIVTPYANKWISIQENDTVALEPLTSPSITKVPGPFRVVSCGVNANARLECGLYSAHPEYRNVLIWKRYYQLYTAPKAFHLAIFSLQTREVCYSRTYCFGDELSGYGVIGNMHDLECQLNDASHGNEIIMLYTTGTPCSSQTLTSSLVKALLRCGASTENIGNLATEEDAAYVLIGVVGSGDGNGHEVIQSGSLRANIDISFDLTRDGFRIIHRNIGVLERYGWSDQKSYLTSALQLRTSVENKAWISFQKKSMPRYDTLCRLEYQEMMEWFSSDADFAPLSKALSIVFVLLGIGHITTKTGRIVWSCIFKKIFDFVLLCLGIWSDEMMEVYAVDEHTKTMSIAFDKPFQRNTRRHSRRKSSKIYPCEGVKTTRNSSSSPQNKESLSSRKSHILSGRVGKDMEANIHTDYALTLHAIVATRAILLQVVPFFSFLSIFASCMSKTPTWITSSKLRKKLPSLFVASPFVHARAEEKAHIDELERIRQNLTEEENFIPNPTYALDPMSGKKVEIDRDTRNKIHEYNAKSRLRMKGIISAQPRVVDEWAVLLNGCSSIFTESRALMYFVDFFFFSFSIALLVSPVRILEYWVVSAIVLMVFVGYVMSLNIIVLYGKSLYITDDEIYIALSYVGLGWVFSFLLKLIEPRRSAKVSQRKSHTRVHNLSIIEAEEGNASIQCSKQNVEIRPSAFVGASTTDDSYESSSSLGSTCSSSSSGSSSSSSSCNSFNLEKISQVTPKIRSLQNGQKSCNTFNIEKISQVSPKFRNLQNGQPKIKAIHEEGVYMMIRVALGSMVVVVVLVLVAMAIATATEVSL